MNTRRLFLVGLSLLVIGAFGFLATALLKPQPRSLASVFVGPSFSGGGGGPSSIADAPLSALVIEKDWPVEMDLNTSDTIAIILTLNTQGTILPIAPAGNHRLAQETPVPVGTPGAPLSEAFGLGYQAFATANLVATTFEITRLGPQEQWLDQAAIEWSWNISPKSLGMQIVDADVEIQWKPLQANSPLPVILTQIWQTRMEINVTDPLLNVGLSVSSQIIGFIGAFGGIGLTVPWIWERVSELVTTGRKKKINTHEARPPATQGTADEKKEKETIRTENGETS